jgi:hypothetical protein
MLYLGAGALYRKDLYTAKIHINAALKAAEQPPIGGVTRLRDSQMLVRALSLDDLLACLELRPCKVTCHYDPGPKYWSALSAPKLNRRNQFAATGFLLKDSTILPPLLKTLVLQVLECYEALCDLRVTAPSSQYSPQTLEARQWVILRTLAARNRLLKFKSRNVRSEPVRVALIIWTLLPPSDLRLSKTAEILAHKLRKVLEPVTYWDVDEDVRLWCLMVGYFAAQDPSDIRAWFMKEICRSIRLHGERIGVRTGPETLETLVAFQRRFLFREPALGPLTEKLARYVTRKTNPQSF